MNKKKITNYHCTRKITVVPVKTEQKYEKIIRNEFSLLTDYLIECTENQREFSGKLF